MKKLTVLLALILSLSLGACSQQNVPSTTDEPSTLTTTETMAHIALPDLLPWPESIVLIENPNYVFDYNDREYIHRFIYYDIPDRIYSSVEHDGISLLIDGGYFHEFDEEPEMALVSFIKYYNIKKDDFIAAVQQQYEWALDKGRNIYDEDCELPNPDIIYTFDNEIINAYYRRENPVVPDEYRTYESYEEYLRANP